MAVAVVVENVLYSARKAREETVVVAPAAGRALGKRAISTLAAAAAEDPFRTLTRMEATAAQVSSLFATA
tara:strand:+ start:218 stop:427 length:210 start_codon:yes stop_codon:yes gene_type:complete